MGQRGIYKRRVGAKHLSSPSPPRVETFTMFSSLHHKLRYQPRKEAGAQAEGGRRESEKGRNVENGK